MLRIHAPAATTATATAPAGAPCPTPIAATNPAPAPVSAPAAAELRSYQRAAVADAIEWLASDPPPGARRLYHAPTGTGKGHVLRAIKAAAEAGGLSCMILAPSLEIVRGLLGPGAPAAEEPLAAAGMAAGITTGTRLQNAVLEGRATLPDLVLVDEVHHWVEDNCVPGVLFTVAPEARFIGLTATPYRANPRETAELHAAWGPPQEIISLGAAVAGGYYALPRVRVVPLVDDDEVKIQGGEFVAKAAGAAVASRIGALAGLIRDLPKRPTCVAVPSTEVAGLLVEELDSCGVDAVAVLQHTRHVDRVRAFEACREGRTVLVQIRVLGEGVDLPWLRQLVDARPTLSAVSWMQQFGRITRPQPGEPPEYVCVCRNAERHLALLSGLVPAGQVKQCLTAFPKPSARSGARGVGLESLKRFKAIPLPLANGLTAWAYSLFCPVEGGCVELVSIVDPLKPEPLVAAREVRYATEEGAKPGYGPWQRLAAPPADLTGYGTQQKHEPFSDKQRQWWERDAARVGLDPHAAKSLKRRQFFALPLALRLHWRFGA